jgi:uncharacterized protein involved in outer membrane biogenesis
MNETAPTKRRRRLWLLPVAAVVLCGAAALAWQGWGAGWLMPRVVARIEAASGLRLTADGPIDARLIPRLGLRAGDVRLAPAAPDAPALVYADATEIELSWAALWRGELRISRLRLTHSRLWSQSLTLPVDIDIAAEAGAVDANLSSATATLHVAARPDGDALALDRVSLQMAGLRLSASGSGRLTLHDPLRLVVTANVTGAESPLGEAALALSYASDGLVLEGAKLRRPDGLAVGVFGHVAPAPGVIRFEGGLDASSENDKDLDGSAAFDGAFGPDGLNLTLAKIDLRTGAGHLSGSAKLRAGAPAQATASLQLDRLDVDAVRHSPAAQVAAAIAAALFDADVGVHVRVDALAAGGRTVADGIIIDASSHAGTIDLHELAARTVLGAPLHASGRLVLGPAPVAAFESVRVKYGEVDAAGRLRLDLSGPRPLLDGDLTTGPLQIDRLSAGPPPLPPEPMSRRALAAARASAPAAPVWSNKPLGLPVAFPFDADIAIAAPRLAWQGYQLTDAHARLEAREHQLGVTDLTAPAYGGRLTFSGRVERSDPPHLTAELRLVGADLGLALSDAGARDIAAHGDLSADLAADGASPADLVNTLAGTVTLTGGEGAIAGIDLASLSERLKQRPTRPTDIIQLARLAAGGRTAFSTLRGHFRVDRGVARTDDLQLTAATAAARLAGSVDVAHQSLDLVSEIQLTEPPGVPPLIVRLDGPLAAPRRIFDISRLQSYLLHGRDTAAPAAR